LSWFTRALTLPSRGRSKGRFAPFGPPLMSNVRRTRMHQRASSHRCFASPLGWAVRPLAASVRSGWLGSSAHPLPCSASWATVFRGRPATALNHLSLANKKSWQAAGLVQRSCFSLALRSTAAPGRWGRVGTGFARAASSGSLRHQGVSKVGLGLARWAVAYGLQPNRSVEGTSNSGLHWYASARSVTLLAAPHLQR
jgi:hypothetical protein